jgi:hypothetical protein
MMLAKTGAGQSGLHEDVGHVPEVVQGREGFGAAPVFGLEVGPRRAHFNLIY